MINSKNLWEIIRYREIKTSFIEEIRKNDFFIDFNDENIFGSNYLAAILNGKKVFCVRNSISVEIMENIPNSYIESFEWLCDQINHLDEVSIDELHFNYDFIYEKFSRDNLATNFVNFLDLN